MVDQARTQQTLERKKQEEILREKLKIKCKEQQERAYLDMRNAECKEILF